MKQLGGELVLILRIFALQAGFGQVCEIVRSLFTSAVPSILPSAWDNSVPTERIFIEFDIFRCFFFFQKICLGNSSLIQI